MDDPHRQPRDGDRNALLSRIEKAAKEGRISDADRDIRLRNVRSAQSMTELDMIGRDLDVLESALAPGSAAAPASTTPVPSPATQHESIPAAAVDVFVDSARGSFRPSLILGVALTVIAIIAAGAIAVFVTTGNDSGTSEPELFEPSVVPEDPIGASPEPGEEPSDEPVEEPEPSSTYALTRAGLAGFLQTYRKQFDTTQVSEAVFYPDYAIVNVPVPGKARHQGWIYRDGDFSDFGGIQANFPGTESVDLRKVDLDALMRNISRARRTLNVEDANQTYVIVRHIPASDEAAMANIYVSNEFHESGYLATTIDGRVIQAYPYSS